MYEGREARGGCIECFVGGGNRSGHDGDSRGEGGRCEAEGGKKGGKGGNKGKAGVKGGDTSGKGPTEGPDPFEEGGGGRSVADIWLL